MGDIREYIHAPTHYFQFLGNVIGNISRRWIYCIVCGVKVCVAEDGSPVFDKTADMN
jgi:nitrate reductase cytochrome c-type subunit